MAFWNKLFGKKEEEQKVGGMEDFMTLIRVYFQAVMAADLHISNLAALPDLRVFKQTLKVPTVNNRLGVAEKASVAVARRHRMCRRICISSRALHRN